MNFLENLAKSIYTGVNKVGSYIGNAFNQGTSNLAGLGASSSIDLSQNQQKIQSALINSGAYNPVPNTGPNVSYTPISSADKLGVKNLANNLTVPGSTLQSQAAFNLSNQLKQQQQNYTTNNPTGPGVSYSGLTSNYDLPQYRNALPTSNGVQDTRVSTPGQGVPYLDTKTGQIVTPNAGFGGLSGGGSSISSFSTQGAQGAPGSGGSNFTGTLGGTGGLGTPSALLAEGDNKPTTKKLTQPQNYLSQPAPTLPGVTPNQQVGATGQAQVPVNNTVINPTGATSPALIPDTQNQLGINMPGTFDISNIESFRPELQKILGLTGASNSNDVQSINAKITNGFAAARAQIEAQNPTPKNVVIETPEQQAFAQNSNDPFGYAQAIDNYKAANTNLSQIHTDFIGAIKDLNAINQTFTAITDDVKNNPDLPKGLAVRRINEFQKANKNKIDEVQGKIAILKEQEQFAQEQVNREFGIVTKAQDREEQKKKDAITSLGAFISSGAIGAFSSADIQKYANATGISSATIQKMKDSAKSPDLKVITKEDAAGNVTGIDEKTGKVLWKVNGVGTPSTSGTGTPDIKEFQGQYATFANRLEQAIPQIASLAPAIAKMDATKLQAYLTASDIAPILSNKLIPDDVKSYIQASKNLINAILRKESGAVISPSEFTNARAQYLPSPGDSTQIIQQKLQNAQINLDNFKRSAGGAYVPFVGGNTTSTGSSGVNYSATLDAILKGQTK